MDKENLLIILNDIIEDAEDHQSYGELFIQIVLLRNAIERGVIQ